MMWPRLRRPSKPIREKDPQVISREYILARKFQLQYYRDVPLFYRTNGEKYVLYKRSGETLSEMRIEREAHPAHLFIHRRDKIRGIQETQQAFNTQLQSQIATGESAKVRETISHIVGETLAEPRSGSLEGLSATVRILVQDYTRDSQILKNLLDVSASDYTTVIHSINVMALVLAYANTVDFTPAQKRVLAISALLHDVGKTRIDPAILKAERQLTDDEFKSMQRHTILGHDILERCRFAESDIKKVALQHHEKMDGRGYPHGLRNISTPAQIIGLIDCYEALTNDDRPYRNAMEPLKALELLRDDVMAGKFSKAKFAIFANSLVGMYQP
jgi:putative nucleotidyltransferase with HDIG domain